MDVQNKPAMKPKDVIQPTLEEVCDKLNDINMREKLLDVIDGCDFQKSLAFQQCIIIPCVVGGDTTAQDTSKTASFYISSLQQIDTSTRDCQALILSPTRERATQFQLFVMALVENIKVHSYLCIGGTNIHDDIRILKNGCHVVVGTPGRVIDMINRKVLNTSNIKWFVLDEAGELLSRDFKIKVKNIFKVLPTDMQIILSATLSQNVSEVKPDLDNKSKKSSRERSKINVSNSNHWVLTKKHQVNIIEERGCKLVDIRKYYEKNGSTFSKKGITLSVEEWKKLLEVAVEINNAIEHDC